MGTFDFTYAEFGCQRCWSFQNPRTSWWFHCQKEGWAYECILNILCMCTIYYIHTVYYDDSCFRVGNIAGGFGILNHGGLVECGCSWSRHGSASLARPQRGSVENYQPSILGCGAHVIGQWAKMNPGSCKSLICDPAFNIVLDGFLKLDLWTRSGIYIHHIHPFCSTASVHWAKPGIGSS